MDEDDDYEEEERQTWVEALTQELADDDVPEEDPDYEVGACCLLQFRGTVTHLKDDGPLQRGK